MLELAQSGSKRFSLFSILVLSLLLASCGQPPTPREVIIQPVVPDWVEGMSGMNVKEIITSQASPEECSGFIDSVRRIEDSIANVEGWILDASAGTTYDRVYLIDMDGLIQGGAAPQFKRSDVTQAFLPAGSGVMPGFRLRFTATVEPDYLVGVKNGSSKACLIDMPDAQPL